ncbi:hypothetical protein LOD99_2345 [Oopsacas minuta]|uniref:Uncharacterized protein n=1 Tax=Oopsacas minuta TaxID=111878 RepID=A0AAV7K1P3_9METZ|nr:hypothetical protein LOD99_2345 [Oopsacas minuta]
MDSSSSNSFETKHSNKYTRILFRPWMILCCSVFLLSLSFGIASLFSPAWAVKNPDSDYVGLLRTCSESFGCFETSSIWCLPDRIDTCEMNKIKLELVFLFFILALFLTLSGVVFSLPFFAPCILVMGVGLSILSTLSYVTSIILFMTIDRYFFTFSTFEEPAHFTYGFYLCAAATAMSVSASLCALKAAHSHIGETHNKKQEKGS